MAATCCIQPIDMVKVRLQTGTPGGPMGIASSMMREGFGTMYRGLSAGLLRQATYTTARLGLYRKMVDSLTVDGKPPSFALKAASGLVSGGLGAIIGSPADLSLIRMQTDMQLPLAERRGYKHAGDALARIVQKEGFRGLFTGAGPTAARAMTLNMGMLASNDQAKEFFEAKGFQKGGVVHILGSGTIAGFFAAFCSLPADYVKTQMQRMRPGPDGRMPYTGSIDCAMKIMAEGGPLKFYTGFPTYCLRVGSHALLTLMILENIQRLQENFGK